MAKINIDSEPSASGCIYGTDGSTTPLTYFKKTAMWRWVVCGRLVNDLEELSALTASCARHDVLLSDAEVMAFETARHIVKTIRQTVLVDERERERLPQKVSPSSWHPSGGYYRWTEKDRARAESIQSSFAGSVERLNRRFDGNLLPSI